MCSLRLLGEHSVVRAAFDPERIGRAHGWNGRVPPRVAVRHVDAELVAQPGVLGHREDDGPRRHIAWWPVPRGDAFGHVGATYVPASQLRPQVLDPLDKPRESSEAGFGNFFARLHPVNGQAGRIHTLQLDLGDRCEGGVVTGKARNDLALTSTEILAQKRAFATECSSEECARL